MPFRNDDIEGMVEYLGYTSVVEYLTSPQWSNILAAVLGTAQWACSRCGKPASTVRCTSCSPEVLRGEDLSRIVAMCRRCAGGRSVDRYPSPTMEPRRKIHTGTCVMCGDRTRRRRAICQPCLRMRRSSLAGARSCK
jgi:hypothetical protein